MNSYVISVIILLPEFISPYAARILFPDGDFLDVCFRA
jgi:hypothetical protein